MCLIVIFLYEYPVPNAVVGILSKDLRFSQRQMLEEIQEMNH